MSETIFDLDAWLTEARPPQRAVTVYGRGDLVSKLQDLTVQRKAADAGEMRLAGHPLDLQIAQVRAELEDSRKVFHVRGLLLEERNTLIDKHTTKTVVDGEEKEEFDGDAYETEAFSLALVSPQLTIAQAKLMHGAIGEGQWAAISNAVQAASQEPVDVPLSRLGSESTQTS